MKREKGCDVNKVETMCSAQPRGDSAVEETFTVLTAESVRRASHEQPISSRNLAKMLNL